MITNDYIEAIDDFRRRESSYLELCKTQNSNWGKNSYHLIIKSYGKWAFTVGVSDSDKVDGYQLREEVTHNVLKQIREHLNLAPRRFHYIASHDYGNEIGMHIHVSFMISTRRRYYWQQVEYAVRKCRKNIKQNIRLHLADPASDGDLCKNQKEYIFKLRDSMIMRQIPRRPFTSPKFPYEFGAKDNYISIDKKDYLLKESQPVELDEEGKLKKRAIDYEIKINKNFR